MRGGRERRSSICEARSLTARVVAGDEGLCWNDATTDWDKCVKEKSVRGGDECSLAQRRGAGEKCSEMQRDTARCSEMRRDAARYIVREKGDAVQGTEARVQGDAARWKDRARGRAEIQRFPCMSAAPVAASNSRAGRCDRRGMRRG